MWVWRENIARGTTDPEIDFVTWTEFGNNMAPLALVAHLATRWRHLHLLQIWPPDGTTYISCKFGHQMALLALVVNLATRWRYLHQLQICPPGGATCISCKLAHQVAPLALVQNLVIRWRHLHWFQSWPSGGATCRSYKFGHQVASLALPHCLGLPIGIISNSIELVSSSARVTSVKFHKGLWVSESVNQFHQDP